MDSVISTDWLAAHFHDPDLRILDLRGSFADFEEAHIPNAQMVHIETLRMSEGGMPCKMHRPEVLAAIFGQLGIHNNTPVVIYATKPLDHLSATYAAWSLAVLGNNHIALLDGGIHKWLRDGHPVTQHFPAIPRVDFRPQFNANIFADWHYVRDRMYHDDVVVVDSRTPALYRGDTGPTIRLGHIPGAVIHNYTWDFTRDGTYRTVEQLRHRYESQGITPDKEVISYCITGREGSAVWFTLTHILGYPRVRLYQASLTEWSAHPELPMVTGSTPQGNGDAGFREAA